RSVPMEWEEKTSQTVVAAPTKSPVLHFPAVAAIVIAAVLGAYYNSFTNGFHLDDTYGLLQNPWIHSLANIPRFFTDPYTLTTLTANADYRPVLQATYALNYAISQYQPWSWHVLNLILHILVVLSLYALGRTLFGSGRIVETPSLSEGEGDWLSMGAAILFAVHPITTGIANYMWA